MNQSSTPGAPAVTGPVVIMGATSGIGKLALDEALSRDIPVRAFARSADDLDDRPNLERVAGDALDPADVARALEGAGAVIYALGVSEGLSMLWEKVTLFSDTTRVLLEQMPKAGVRRLVAVTGFGAGRSADAQSSVERMAFRAFLGRPYADKDRQEEMIMASDLDWTIVRPVVLTHNAKSGKVQVLRDPDRWRNGLVSRADVAAYLVDAVAGGLDIRNDVVLAR
ncbi:NAD(P)H-binding protein [Rhodobacterales bacterium HKCCE2091]|nr:NAD(P)H-binding protein [Rhodobacterales bacterium HKCCE2091]